MLAYHFLRVDGLQYIEVLTYYVIFTCVVYSYFINYGVLEVAYCVPLG
jgi:hypothetical protein